MRIAFTGAAGTGKTVLAEWVRDAFGLPLNPVGSRSVAASMGFDSPYDVDAAGKRAEFQQRLITEKAAWERSYGHFVTDRTTFDNLAYAALHDVRCITTDMLKTAVEGYDRYDLVIYCPEEVFIDIADDPQREDNLTYHKVYDAVLMGLVTRFALRPEQQIPQLLTLTEADLDQRKQMIRDFLGSIQGP